MAWVLDLDGVVWLGRKPIAGAAEAVQYLRARGHHVVFATNFSASPVGVIEEALGDIGIDARGDVVTSAMAAASLIEPGQRAAIVGGDGISEALCTHGVQVVDAGQPAEAVVVGMAYDLSYSLLDAAFQTLQKGAALIATNDDPTYPGSEGLHPGAGSIVAALERCSGMTALVAGKPNDPQARLIRGLVDGTETSLPSGAVRDIMIGDRTDSDGLFAHHLGYAFGHVLTGVEQTASDAAQYVAPSLMDMAKRHG
ncbi:MAG: HAD-IIA family hydrolase [Acidimicrobiales bacterium]